MVAARFSLPRVEGGAEVVQTDEGRLHLAGPPPRRFERLLLQRAPLEAVYLSQQISADNSVSHALAAVGALEQAAGVGVAENGRLLREVLHTASLMHAHVRHFYFQALPDYLPAGSLADYGGRHPALVEQRAALAERPEGHWTRLRFEHPFEAAEVARLWEHRMRAEHALNRLQRLMATLGGKFPMVMSIVPGGISAPVSEETLLTLRRYLAEVRGFLDEAMPGDAELLLRRHPELTALGRGVPDYLCTGSGEDELAFEGALFPSGVYVNGQLETFAAVATESLHSSYFRVAAEPGERGAVLEAAPEKPGAYSWVRALRYNGRPMETGPLPRMVIAYLSGSRLWGPALLRRTEEALGGPAAEGNSVGGRLLVRLMELRALTRRCEGLLDSVDPAQPLVSGEPVPPDLTGEGLAHVEAAVGALHHHLVAEGGLLVHYGLATPNAWNASPLDEAGQAGGLETALNRSEHDLTTPGAQRTVMRIVQAFALSMSDATH